MALCFRHFWPSSAWNGDDARGLAATPLASWHRSVVEEFVRDGTLTTRWGNRTPTRQAYEIKIFETKDAWDRKGGGPFQDFIKSKRNIFRRFEKEVEKRTRPRTRVFVVLPIQGDCYGTQSEQTIHKIYDERFEAIETTLQEFDCVAIRIDKESPIGGLVSRIKDEVRRAGFIVADLTDERPSVTSRSGMRRHFTNNNELSEKLKEAVSRNRQRLLDDNGQAVDAADEIQSPSDDKV